MPPFFYVDVPDDFRPNRPFKASSAPEAGVSFTGVRRDVRIEDVVRAMGPRVPADGPPVFRQAFVLVADESAPATEARVRDGGPHPLPVRPLFHRGHGRTGASPSPPCADPPACALVS